MKFRPFEELFEFPLRNGLTKPKRVRGEGFKMVNMGELFAFPRIYNAPMDRVPLTTREKESSMLADGDLLFARQSLVREGAGQCSIFITDEEEVCFESHIIRCRLDQEVANPFFYYYFFRSFQGKQVIDAIIEQGAGASGIRGSDLAKLQVPYIEKEVQDEIAAQLNTIDDKIELNRQINQTLEHIAQAIFKSWFVDFDPVKAKIQAKQNNQDSERAAMCAISGKTDAELDAFLEASTPEQRQQLTVTAALFPDELEDSDLGAIPKGWSSGITGDLFELHRGYDLPKKKRIAGKYFVYAAGGTHGTHNEYKIEPPGIITGRSGVIGNAFLSLEKFWPLNTTLYIREFRACGPYYAFHFLKSCDFSVFNSGSAVPSLNRNFVHSLKTIIPDPELLMTFEKLVAPIFEMVKHQNDESRTMSSLRNEMLPKLLSGEIILSGTLSAAASVAC